jgi:hypothetical protein
MKALIIPRIPQALPPQPPTKKSPYGVMLEPAFYLWICLLVIAVVVIFETEMEERSINFLLVAFACVGMLMH